MVGQSHCCLSSWWRRLLMPTSSWPRVSSVMATRSSLEDGETQPPSSDPSSRSITSLSYGLVVILYDVMHLWKSSIFFVVRNVIFWMLEGSKSSGWRPRLTSRPRSSQSVLARAAWWVHLPSSPTPGPKQRRFRNQSSLLASAHTIKSPLFGQYLLFTWEDFLPNPINTYTSRQPTLQDHKTWDAIAAK